MTAMPPEEIVNLARYPIAASESPACRQLVRTLKDELDARQYCALPEFVRDTALTAMIAEVEGLRGLAFRNKSRRNCYLQRREDPALPKDHPRNLLFESSSWMIAADRFAATSPLKQLYGWPPFQRMVAGVVGESRLYPSADPLQPVNVVFYGRGDRSTWHFDSTNAFTMTLMLQAAEQGGDFEIAPNTRRSPDDPEVSGLRAVLLGERARVVPVPREPGALVIFRGCNSVHRVTAVQGRRDRMMAVFVYETEPGVVGDPEVNETVYGRRGATV